MRGCACPVWVETLVKAGVHQHGKGRWRRGSAAGSPPSSRRRRSSGWRRAARPCRRSPTSSGCTPTSSGLAQRATGGRHGRGPGRAEGGGRRAGAAAAREQAARAGGRDPQACRGFFREGGCRLVRYRFVAAERATFPVRMLCRLVGVAASGFYAWLRRRPSRRHAADRRVGERIGAIFEASPRTYGSPRVHAELRAEGVRVGRERVALLMRRDGLAVARRRRRVPRTTDSRHDHPVAPNLLDRNFAAERPDTVWLADLSYIRPGKAGRPRRDQGPGHARDRGWAWPTTCGPSWRATPCGWPCSGGSRRRG